MTLTALILGDYKLERTAIPLSRRGFKVVVWSEQPPPPSCDGWVRWHPRSGEITAEVTRAVARDLAPDLVVPNIYAETEEHALVEYAAAASQGWYVHPMPFAEICVDKVRLHEVCTEIGVRVPRGRVCDDDDSLWDFVRRHAPVVVKQARSQARHGIWYCRTLSDAERLCPALRYPVIVQEALRGEELAMEVLSTPRGSVCFPLLSSGDLDETLDPQLRLRTAPKLLDPVLAGELAQIITTFEAQLHPNGIWQLDLAISGGHVFLIEVNGRLGGASDIGLAITGVDPHEAYVGAALSDPQTSLATGQMVIAVPLVPGYEPPRPTWWDGDFLLERYPGLPIWRLTLATAHASKLLGITALLEQEGLRISQHKLTRRVTSLCHDFAQLQLATSIWKELP